MGSQPAESTPSTEFENIIEAILLLYAMAVPAADIARRLHIDQATTLYVIQTGTLPARQLTLAFQELPAVRPLDGEGER